MIYVAPDRLRIDAVSEGMRATRVVIGKLTWVKFGEGKWQKVDLPANVDPFANIRDANTLAKNIRNYVVRFVGTQSLDGKSMHVYDYAAQPKKGFSAKQSRIWIGIDDGFPHRIVQQNGPLKATLTYSRFNAPLSVSGPG
jgi:outer membrane lipoprotein-sorting protein